MENENHQSLGDNSKKKKTKKLDNSAKNNIDCKSLMFTKDKKKEEEDEDQQAFTIVNKKSYKFDSSIRMKIDNDGVKILKKEKSNKPLVSDIQKKAKIEQYIDKLYDDNHFKKSVFKKKPSKKFNMKSFHTKVSFQKIQKKNEPKLNKKKLSGSNYGIKLENIMDDDEDEPVYGYNKKYYPCIINRKIKNNDSLLKTSSLIKKFDIPNLNHKPVNKTFKSLKTQKIRSLNKKFTNKTIIIPFHRIMKKKRTSKSNEKKIKKRVSKLAKDKNNKENERDKDENNPKNINNINIHNEDKIKKNNEESFFDDKNKKNENEKKTNIIDSKNKKKQDNSIPIKPGDNIETLIIDEQKVKKRKINFCCNPFLLCFKLDNNEYE